MKGDGRQGARAPLALAGATVLLAPAAAVLAFVLAAAPAGAGTPISAVVERPDLAARAFELINGYRASLGLPRLAWDDRLAAAAAWHAAWIASLCRFERADEGDVQGVRLADGCALPHRDYLGRSPGQRAAAFGFPYAWAVGENIAASSVGPEDALVQWRNSPGHDANQRRPDYALLGVGTACSRYQDDVFGTREICIYVADFALSVTGDGTSGAAPGQAPVAGPRAVAPSGGGGPAAGTRAGAVATADPCAGREAAPRPAAVATYVVQAGDTLAGLAARFLGDPSRYCDLAAWNGIGAPYLLRVGQELVVPAASGEGAGQEAASAGHEGGRQEQGETATGYEAAHSVEGEGIVEAGAAPGGDGAGEVTAVPVRARQEGKPHPVVAFFQKVGRFLKGLWPW